MAGLSAATGSTGYPLPSVAVSALCLPLVVFLAYGLSRRLASPLLSTAAVAAALTSRDALEVFASGMETPLFLCLILLSLDALARGANRRALFVAALLPFLHPDGALLFPAIFLAARVASGKWRWKDAVLALVPPFAIALLLTNWFGSPVPHSIVAKSSVYVRPAGYAFGELARALLTTLVPGEPLQRLPDSLSAVVTTLEILSSLLAAALLVALTLRWSRSKGAGTVTLATFVFAAAFFAAFAIANPSVFSWYLPPFRLTLA